MNEMNYNLHLYIHIWEGNIPEDMLGIWQGINHRKEYALDMLLDMLWHIFLDMLGIC